VPIIEEEEEHKEDCSANDSDNKNNMSSEEFRFKENNLKRFNQKD